MWLLKRIFLGSLILLFLFLAVQKMRNAPQNPIFMLNGTASVPIGLYIAIPTVNYRDGDLIVFRDEQMLAMSKEYGWLPKDAGEVTFIKHIGLPGSHYEITEDGSYYVSGRYIGKIAKDDGKGHDLPQLPKGNYIVPAGHFITYTPMANSYDGRYTGPISQDKVIHRIVPLITW